ncbi:GAF domain-containing protein [Thermocatellispora tengchongensis]|uniref:GAF domain-containing protein n=1 Tax=Thermocatellispora tengchongensis TaxID=1073253 RepID=A0A840P9U8_9ACTN|nr:GAF domain-containing protein [Thermocatellispora tengchongensis]MBB5134631.1 GAF domain-containing protein [Thermocatellispora tengchongensis]
MIANDPPSSASAEIAERRLLQSIVEVARHVFGSAAASIFLVDQDTGELVFEAVSGEGETHLLGRRFPPGTGIAGWVAESGQPMIADDLTEVTQFAHDAARSTGYVPRSIMAAPLIRHEECIGVLEVLDRSNALRGDLADVDLLALLAVQAACGLDFLLRLRRANRAAPPGDDLHVLLRRIATRVPPGGATDPTALKLLAVADELLA